MKVIDLLNKIANGDIDDLPDAIKYKGNVYGYDGLNQNYVRRINFTMDFLIGEDITAILNDEVEIIEEDKEITKLENEKCRYDYATYDSYKDKIDKTLYLIRAINLLETKIDVTNDKINEIIDKINSMEVK